MIEHNEHAFAALMAKITRDHGFRCASYKDKCIRRRIAVRMRARGLFTFREYSAMLDADPREYPKLLSALTINVTKFFRNWETYHTVARRIIPELWSGSARQLKVWSAGCSSGEEAYSIGVLFHQHAESLGELSHLSRVHIIGTDIDDDCLGTAQRGVYGEASFTETPPALRERYFPHAGPLRGVLPAVKKLATFTNADLLRDPPPSTKLDLIFCRNVIIYFDRAAQDKLFAEFHATLRDGGVLVMGKVETLLGHARDLFRAVSSRERIFRRA
jgi:chemotaxis methyl-accepting protein methylase